MSDVKQAVSAAILALDVELRLSPIYINNRQVGSFPDFVEQRVTQLVTRYCPTDLVGHMFVAIGPLVGVLARRIAEDMVRVATKGFSNTDGYWA